MYTKGTQRPTEVIGRNTSFYSIYTLIDVTDSNVSSPKINAKKFYQSQNLNTFMQVIGLRTQPIISSVTKLESQNMAEYNFGNDYTGTHTIWLMKFVSETEGAWNKDDIETSSHNIPHDYDKTGESLIYANDIYMSSGGTIRVYCTDWSNKLSEYLDNLKVTIGSQELVDFFNNEAYK